MAERTLTNFIQTFIESTEPLGSPLIFRQWTAISVLAALLEQRVWIRTSNNLHPNLYIFLIAHPGVGKTRTISEGRLIVKSIEELHLAPVSLTFASLVDALTESKRTILRVPEGEITYNSMFITADELGAFMHKYDNEMIDGLSAFYDPMPYSQRRRTGDLKVKILSPQLNIIAGSTPTNLVGFMPEKAWGQGFSSRLILVFSDQRIIVDDFAERPPSRMPELIADAKLIFKLSGQFQITAGYKDAVSAWRASGELPVPQHPRLIHYVTRRRVHIYKLSMIASVNRDNGLVLMEEDFFTALEWLLAAETFMEDVFKSGAANADASAMTDILHYIKVNDVGSGVSEHRILNFASKLIPINSVGRVIDLLEGSGQIKKIRVDPRTKARIFVAMGTD